MSLTLKDTFIETKKLSTDFEELMNRIMENSKKI